MITPRDTMLYQTARRARRAGPVESRVHQSAKSVPAAVFATRAMATAAEPVPRAAYAQLASFRLRGVEIHAIALVLSSTLALPTQR